MSRSANFGFSVGLVLVCTSVWAASKSGENSPPASSARYQQCVGLTKENAQEGLNSALAWRNARGGSAAEHCAALALVQLKRYDEAAAKLDGLARGAGDAAMRTELHDQAGNAWLLAAQPGNAERSFSDALALAPSNTDILADRARAKAMRKNWQGADIDLSAALAIDPDRVDLLVLRASARHAQGRKKEARGDIDHALDIFPGYADALVERGAMKFETGDAKGAKLDWQAVIASGRNSPAAVTAQRYLQEMNSN